MQPVFVGQNSWINKCELVAQTVESSRDEEGTLSITLVKDIYQLLGVGVWAVVESESENAGTRALLDDCSSRRASLHKQIQWEQWHGYVHGL